MMRLPPSVALAVAVLFVSAVGLVPAAAAVAPADAAQAADTARVVTLAPSATELVAAAGALRNIVGIDRSSDYPPAVRAVPRVGDVTLLDDESILKLHPTLVVAWQRTLQTDLLQRRLQPLGIPILYADPKTLEAIPDLIRTLGRRLGTTSQANHTAGDLDRRIAALGPTPVTQRTVFIEVSSNPLYTLGADPLINDMLDHCGGRNLYADTAVAAPQVSVESVLHLNPDVVILSPYGHETLPQRRAWWAQHGLAAALKNHIYAVNPDWLHRPGPRFVDAAEAICRDIKGPH